MKSLLHILVGRYYIFFLHCFYDFAAFIARNNK